MLGAAWSRLVGFSASTLFMAALQPVGRVQDESFVRHPVTGGFEPLRPLGWRLYSVASPIYIMLE
jgi:hypothetical protein